MRVEPCSFDCAALIERDVAFEQYVCLAKSFRGTVHAADDVDAARQAIPVDVSVHYVAKFITNQRSLSGINRTNVVDNRIDRHHYYWQAKASA